MKAVVLHETKGPEGLRIEEIETPNPGPGEVRVKLRTSALNRRDYWLTIGKYPGITLPCTTGSDGAGLIDAVGPGGNELLIGKEVVVYPARAWGDEEHTNGPDFRVLGMPDQGTFAEYICVPDTDVFERPAHLSWEQAAAVPLAGLTAWRAVVTHAEAAKGKKILVTAAGSGVSTFAIQWALGHGAEVYVTSGSEEKIERVKKLGVTAGVSYRDDGFTEKLRELSGGFDAIIDSAGGASMNPLLATLKSGGRYIFFGATTGNPPEGLMMAKIFLGQIRIQGTTMGSPREFAAMLDFVNHNRIEPLVHEVFPLEQAVKAHQLMESFSQSGKIVLRNETD